MALNIADVEDCILQAKHRFNKMHQEVVQEYMAPYTELTKALIYQMMDPQMKAEIQKKDPSLAKEMEKKYGRKEK
jgi:cysteinyl-tRNA synthetase